MRLFLTGFSVHNGVRVRAGDAEGRKKLAQYMLRAPFSLEKMTYLPATGMVMYRSHMHKGLKRNFQLLPGAQWLDQRAPPAAGEGIDAPKPPVREWTYHAVPDIA